MVSSPLASTNPSLRPTNRRTPSRRRPSRCFLEVEVLEARNLLAGTWTALTHLAPSGIGTMMLLTDGTVMAQGGGDTNSWYKLTPAVTGSYISGTWSTLASMSLQRLYFASNVLPSDKVFVLGGEYSSGAQNWINSGEIYDPVANSWSAIPNFPQSQFGDDPSEVLANGNILVGYLSSGLTYLFNPTTSIWSAAGTKLLGDRSDEETWIELPDGSILSYDVFNTSHAQRYVPSSNTWVDAGTVPVALTSGAVGSELGPGFLLNDGRVFQIGANGNTALYTPSSNTWVAGPVIPNSKGADDAPGAILSNGHVLFAADTYSPIFTPPTQLFDFDPVANTITQVVLPTALTTALNGDPSYVTRMLALPSGDVLLTTSSNQLWDFNPNATASSSLQPTITSIAFNGGTTFTLTGTQLNGVSEGASYGDDAEMASNYPIVQLSGTTGNVYYARTFNWTSQVATGSTPVTTQFTLPAGLPVDSYTVKVIANGIASASAALPLLVVSSTPATGAVVSTPLTSFTVTFNEPIANPASVSASILKVNGLSANSVTFNGAATTATFTFITSPVTTQGGQTMTIAANSLTGVNGSSNAAFSASFDYGGLATLGSQFTGLAFHDTQGYIPPDTSGAAGTVKYVETVNQDVRISNKADGSSPVTDTFSHFWYTVGGLPQTSSSSFLSDPIVVWDSQVQRFIIGDQDVDSTNYVSRFDLAVSKSASPTTLTTADWYFLQINTTENNGSNAIYDADYPGNFGYNHDAFVFTLNMFAVVGSNHVQVNSVNLSNLVNGTLTAFRNDVANVFSLRPTVMHDSVAGDPMWLITEGGNNASLNVLKMTNVLSNNASFTTTNLAVNAYSGINYPLQPNGTQVVTNIDTRIMDAAEWNGELVATHHVGVGTTEDDARWYLLNVSSGTPRLLDQGDVANPTTGSGTNNVYDYYPGIDINSAGAIGLSFMQSSHTGTNQGEFMSMYVTGRLPGDAPGTMATPVRVQAGATNYSDFGQRAGDLSGINVDTDGTFWGANEYANTDATANWGTAIAHFNVSLIAVASTIPANGASVSTPPTSFVVTFNEAVANPASVPASILKTNGLSANTVTFNGAATTATFTYTTSPVTAQGVQSLTIPASAVTGTDGTSNLAYSSSFYYDVLTLAVTSTTPALGGNFGLPAGSFTYNVTFDEPIDPATAGTGNLTLSQGTVTAFSVQAGNQTVSYTITGLTRGLLTVTIPAGILKDQYDNIGFTPFTGIYAVHNSATALPTLTTTALPGSLIYSMSGSDGLLLGGDTDHFALAADPGQTLTVLVTPAASSGLTPTIQLADPSSTVLGSAVAAGPHQNALLQTIATTTSGTYTLTIGGAGGTFGNYTLQVYLDAAQEAAAQGIGSDNTRATAQNLNSAFVGLQTSMVSGSRGAVLGSVGQVVLNATAAGWWDSTGSHTAGNNNYLAGQYPTNYANPPALVQSRDFFVFNLANVNPTILSAQLNLSNPATGYSSPLTSDTLGLFDVSTSLAALQASGSGQTGIFTDLGSGTSFGSQTVSAASNGQTVATSMNAAGLAALNGSRGGQFAVGGALTSLTGSSPQYLFFGTGNGADTTQLVLNLADSRYYSFSLTAGQLATVGLKYLSGSGATLTLQDSNGNTLATGAAGATNLDEVISNFAAPAAGTYYVVVSGSTAATYSLLVTRDATLDTESHATLATAQALAGPQGVLGAIASPRAIRVAVQLSSANPAYTTNLVNQLNNDTEFSFHAVAVSDAQMNSVAQLDNYDVVMLADYATPISATTAAALKTWVQSGQGGLVASAWLNTNLDYASSAATRALLASIVPINIGTPGNWSPSYETDITNSSQPVTQGVTSFNAGGAGEAPLGGVAAGASILAVDGSGRPAVAVGQFGGGRSVWLNADYEYTNVGLSHLGSADRLLEQALAWAAPLVASVDWYKVTLSGGQNALQVETSTPLAGPSLVINTLSPSIQLFNASGTLIASGTLLADGHNQSLSATGLTPGATYYVKVTAGINQGEYFLGVSPFQTPGVTLPSRMIASLQVSSFTPTTTGFVVTFNKPINPSALSLYGVGQAAVNPPGLTLTGPGGTVKGTVLLDATDTTLTFVQSDQLLVSGAATAGELADGSYTLTLSSGPNGFQDTAGNALDGAGNGGTASYVTHFSTNLQAAAVGLSITDFAVGPGQPVNLGEVSPTGLGIPINISDGDKATMITFSLTYNPSLLVITGLSADPGTPGTSTFIRTPGTAVNGLETDVFTFNTNGASLGTGNGPVTLGELTANVPSSAQNLYQTTALLDISAAADNGMQGTLLGVDGVQVNAYLGDTSGNGSYDPSDAVLAARVAAGSDTGFAAYRLVDPALVGGVSGAGYVAGADASQIAAFTVGKFASAPFIARLPSPALAITPAGPDPTLTLPALVPVSAGGVVQVPVNIDDPRPAGSTGLTEATLALTYDPKVLSVSPQDIQLGSVPLSGTGWTLTAAVDPATGQIGITLYSLTPIGSSIGGSLVTIDFHALAGASGASPVQLLAGANPSGGAEVRTGLDDSLGPLTLHVAPTSAFSPIFDGPGVLPATSLLPTGGLEIASTSASAAEVFNGTRKTVPETADPDLPVAAREEGEVLASGLVQPVAVLIFLVSPATGVSLTMRVGMVPPDSALPLVNFRCLATPALGEPVPPLSALTGQNRLEGLLWGSPETGSDEMIDPIVQPAVQETPETDAARDQYFAQADEELD